MKDEREFIAMETIATNTFIVMENTKNEKQREGEKRGHN